MNNPRNGTTVLSCTLVFLAQLGSTLCLPVLPQIGNDIGLTEAIASLSLVVFFAGCAAPLLVWGVLADRCGRRVAVVTALLLFSMAAGVAANAATPSVFLAARAIQGVGAGGMAVLGRILIADTASAADLAKRMSLLSFTFVLALGGGQFLGGVIQDFFFVAPSFYDDRSLGNCPFLIHSMHSHFSPRAIV
ncbi:MFS transporter [Herbaspirillum camelliae]|uniref:MFS transporter n=1 Tax=Herbaspirillum camelliae TaxID=1892903 RepID=UPI000949D463|nr:MFS transporter [Herbaspirillum camelliae]